MCILGRITSLFLLLPVWAALGVQHDFINQEKTWNYSKSYKLTQLEPYNLRSPVDFYGGPVYMRYECVSKPGEDAGYKTSVQMCCWIGGASNEGCSVDLQYYKKGVYFYKFPARENWILSKISGDLPWTGQMTVGLPHKYQSKINGWLATGCSYCCDQSGGCTEDILDKYYLPTVYKAHVIMVKPGDQLVPPAGWENCPAEWPGCVGSMAIDLGGGWYYASEQNIARAVLDKKSSSIIVRGLSDAHELQSAEILDLRGRRIAKISTVSLSDGTVRVSLEKATLDNVQKGMHVIKIAGSTLAVIP